MGDKLEFRTLALERTLPLIFSHGDTVLDIGSAPTGTESAQDRLPLVRRIDMLALSKNPPITWPDKLTLADPCLAWSAVYCKPRQEKALAHELCRKKVPYFLPMVLRETISGHRRRRNLYPLFPSYLFFAGDETQRLALLKTDRIVRIITISESEQPKFRQEMLYLQTAVEHFPESLELYPRLVAGAPVRVTAGPLKNVEGIVIQSQNKKKLWLGVSILGVGATLEIHADFVESIH